MSERMLVQSCLQSIEKSPGVDDARSEPPRAVDVMGLPIRPFEMNELIEEVVRCARSGVRALACYANAHTMNLAAGDTCFQEVLSRADLLYADGASIVWASRFAERRVPCRITAMDYFPPLLRRCADEGLSVYLLGSAPGVAQLAADSIARQVPGLRITGAHQGHFDLEESGQIIARINAAAPDILFVGMSSPRQEFWLHRHAGELNVPVRWCVGALFDYLAGKERRAPAWFCRNNLEWLFRFCMDPMGKWRRYLIGNPLFVWNALRWAWRRSRSEKGAEALPAVRG